MTCVFTEVMEYLCFSILIVVEAYKVYIFGYVKT